MDTLIGFTFEQVIAVIGLSGAILTVWINMNVRMKAVEVKVKLLEELRAADLERTETIRCENREDHKIIMDKLDNLINKKTRT